MTFHSLYRQIKPQTGSAEGSRDVCGPEELVAMVIIKKSVFGGHVALLRALILSISLQSGFQRCLLEFNFPIILHVSFCTVKYVCLDEISTL